ncbi:MAG: pyridoxal 5'-phosphate synthase glutaminase subunit PdxT [Myxococcales bacterium]|nr:MAG: pyridoxal 5'-phosphate synthase glutaminase subunit PdxT [Myxococcales bacterium]
MTTPAKPIGVLALQGAFREHRRALERLGAPTIEVRLPEDLERVAGLIMPGGESTTIGKLLIEWKLLEPLRRRALAGMPLWGTCAGAILMAQRITERGREMDQPRLDLLPMTAVRNAFGRQRESFEADLTIAGIEGSFHAVFIRAPFLEPFADSPMEVLTRVGEDAVFVRHKHLMATSFHPELTDDPRIHRFFLNLVARAEGR